MPELPEVETTRRGIEPHLLGKRVVQVTVRQAMLRWPVSEDLAQCFTGKTIVSVGRRAKYLFLETDDGKVMLHLGMSGSLRILREHLPAGAHDHVDFVMDDGCLLRFKDPRRFGSIFWLAGEDHPLLEKLGPEPLSSDFDGNYLHEKSRKRKVSVKSFIMNGHVVVGVGNIYANEALYHAGIRPDRSAGRISKARYITLGKAIKEVLTRAIEAGGTTLKDFVREDGSPGYFGQSLAVYGRGGQQCHDCQKILVEIRQGGRASVFCSVCQR
ncbi:MAG: bifunctional DNA-formamidopyrimidine glycosylase/DNA-(apurinic or apyrimidinic site) lyase [Pseudomonadales bacterium]